MARLQILEPPSGINDQRPPFLLVIDEVTEGEAERITGSQEAFDGVVKKAGARAAAVFHGMTLRIPANDPLPAPTIDEPDLAGTTEIVYAHERTRLDLCSALLVSGDTTWRKLIEIVGERQRELAGLYRKLDVVVKTNPDHPLTKQDVQDVIRHELDRAARMGQRGMR